MKSTDICLSPRKLSYIGLSRSAPGTRTPSRFRTHPVRIELCSIGWISCLIKRLSVIRFSGLNDDSIAHLAHPFAMRLPQYVHPSINGISH